VSAICSTSSSVSAGPDCCGALCCASKAARAAKPSLAVGVSAREMAAGAAASKRHNKDINAFITPSNWRYSAQADHAITPRTRAERRTKARAQPGKEGGLDAKNGSVARGESWWRSFKSTPAFAGRGGHRHNGRMRRQGEPLHMLRRVRGNGATAAFCRGARQQEPSACIPRMPHFWAIWSQQERCLTGCVVNRQAEAGIMVTKNITASRNSAPFLFVCIKGYRPSM